MTITSTTGGASIRYTIDGSTPSSTVGTIYSTPVSIAATTTLKAIAYKSGMTDSTVTTGVYTISAGGGSTVYDANALTVAASSGCVTDSVNNAGTSNGNFLRYKGTAVGDYITFNVSAPATATYTISVRYAKLAYGGICQLAIDGTNQGSTSDIYASSTTLATFSLGNKSLTDAYVQVPVHRQERQLERLLHRHRYHHPDAIIIVQGRTTAWRAGKNRAAADCPSSKSPINNNLDSRTPEAART